MEAEERRKMLQEQIQAQMKMIKDAEEQRRIKNLEDAEKRRKKAELAQKINSEILKIKELEAKQAEETRKQETVRRAREAEAERQRQVCSLTHFLLSTVSHQGFWLI